MKREDFETDFELNIASIVDCLTVLITYLLAAATFLSLGMMTVTLPSYSSDSTPPETPSLLVTIQLLGNGKIKIKRSGKENGEETLSGETEEVFQHLGKRLESIKDRHPNISNVMVGSSDNVHYGILIKTIEVTRKVIPQIAISTEDI